MLVQSRVEQSVLLGGNSMLDDYVLLVVCCFVNEKAWFSFLDVKYV